MSHIDETLLAEYFATAIAGGTTSDSEVFVDPDPPPDGFVTRPGHRRLADAIARYLNKYDEPGVSAATTFTPTLLLSGAAHGGGYTNRQGYYVKLADFIIAAIYIQTAGNISISGGSIQFSGLPEAGSMLTTLAFWPTFVSQGSLVGGALYGRLRPGTSTNIGLNDSGAQQGLTSWTFSNHLFFCSVGCVYRVS